MKSKFSFLVIILGLFGSQGHAMAMDCPGSLKPRLPVLTLNAEVIVRQGEKHSFGTVLKRGENFPVLKDGTHIFILDQDQNLVVAERYPDLDELNPVVTHRSLYRKLEESLGAEPKLIALGEIQVELGMISFVSNNAGTAFLPNEYLSEMVAVLKERGLPISEKTQITPFDQVRSGHDPEHEVARYRIQVEKDPKLKAMSQKLMEIRSQVYQRFPSPEKPGTVDWKAFLFSSSGPENKFHFSEMNEPERFIFGGFDWLENMNDRYRVLPLLVERMGYEKLEYMINNLLRLEGIFISH